MTNKYHRQFSYQVKFWLYDDRKMARKKQKWENKKKRDCTTKMLELFWTFVIWLPWWCEQLDVHIGRFGAKRNADQKSQVWRLS